MKKIEKLFNEFADRRKRKEALSDRTVELEKLIEERTKAAESAAAAGDVAAYMSIKADVDQLAAELHVTKVQHDLAAKNLDPDECQEAWKAYAADYEKNLAKAEEDYKKALNDFAAKYLSVIRTYNDACAERERLAALCGKGSGEAKNLFRMKELPLNEYDLGETDLFRRHETLPGDTWMSIRGILFTGHSNSAVL